MSRASQSFGLACVWSVFSYIVLSREYVEALQSEMVERDQNAVIQQLLTEARSVVCGSACSLRRLGCQTHLLLFDFQREELVDKSKKYESFKAELDSLYSRIFDGPSECEFGTRSIDVSTLHLIFFPLPDFLI